MYYNPKKYASLPVGVVIRRSPGVTQWAKWAWKAIAVLPAAPPADWKVLRDEGGVTDFHAATATLELHGAEAEAYMHGLAAETPSVFVVLRQAEGGDAPFEVLLVTASPYEAQDYDDNGDDVVEKVPMPEGLVTWVRDFAERHYEEEPFKKRKRDKKRVDKVEDGKGDARISQLSDVYRSPARTRKERLQ